MRLRARVIDAINLGNFNSSARTSVCIPIVCRRPRRGGGGGPASGNVDCAPRGSGKKIIDGDKRLLLGAAGGRGRGLLPGESTIGRSRRYMLRERWSRSSFSLLILAALGDIVNGAEPVDGMGNEVEGGDCGGSLLKILKSFFQRLVV